MKVFDCFTYFNENNLLKVRLEYLNKFVDYFVISESDYTHSGIKKGYNFKMSDFSKYKKKIIYLPIEADVSEMDFSVKDDKYNPNSPSWILENTQRNALLYGLESATPDDIVLIGDLDEIPNRDYIKTFDNSEPMSLMQSFYYYYMNYQNMGYDKYWKGTIISKYSNFGYYTPQEMRDKRNEFDALLNGGWHFSFLGGIDSIRKKIESFAHTEFNKDDYKSDEHILDCIKNGKDVFKREGVYFKLEEDLRVFPTELIQAFLHHYPQATYIPS